MSSTVRAIVFAICCFGFALPAAAQLDSAALRVKFGPPLNRETFHMSAGFDLVVDYGPSQQVCALEVPALMPANDKEKVSNTSVMKQQMYAFLADLVPAAMRGKELQRMLQLMGAFSVEVAEYEHVVVSEAQNANQPLGGKITVRFTNDECKKPADQ